MNQWQPISTLPKELGKEFDIWAKTWDYKTNIFKYIRFPNCKYNVNHIHNIANMIPNFYPLYWMDIPQGPFDE